MNHLSMQVFFFLSFFFFGVKTTLFLTCNKHWSLIFLSYTSTMLTTKTIVIVDIPSALVSIFPFSNFMYIHTIVYIYESAMCARFIRTMVNMKKAPYSNRFITCAEKKIKFIQRNYSFIIINITHMLYVYTIDLC